MFDQTVKKQEELNYSAKVASPTKEKKPGKLNIKSVEDFIYTFTGSEANKTIVVETTSHFDINKIEELELKNLVNLKQINDSQNLNRFFLAVNKKLPDKGILICCAETVDHRDTKINNKDSFLSTILGMLIFNGFKLNYSKEFNNLTYFVAEKISEPLSDSKQKIKFYLGIKIFVDFFIVFTSLTFLFPVFLLISIGIKIDSRGPLLFKQKRIGKNLKAFYIYKFRTMIKDAHSKQTELQKINEMKGGRLFKCDNDPRITSFGKFLRKYSIDELPQLINILKGDMSIIGPRPLSTPVNMYEPYQLKRFIIKPGLGCIWQAYYRKETNFTKWIKTDLLYITKASPWVDTKLSLHILMNVICGKGSR